MDKVEGKVSRGTGGLNAYVGRLRMTDACINGIVFEGRTKLHVITSQPDVRIVSVDKASEGRSCLASPVLVPRSSRWD